jgi:predicted ATPase
VLEHREEASDMLLRFEVSNHRSIMDPVELSMIAVDKDRPATRGFDLLTERVLTVAGVYGPNASGKSNLLEALRWLSGAVSRSLRAWDEIIPREPFKFNKGPTSPSTYELEMMVAGVRYTYRLEVNDSEVLFEGLYSYPERRRRALFERDGMEVSFRRGLGGLAGTRELLTPTTLVLTAASRLGEPDIRSFARSIADIVVLGAWRKGTWRRIDPEISITLRMFENRIADQDTLFEVSSGKFSSRETALALLRLADVGIDDVQVADVARDPLPRDVVSLRKREAQRRLSLMHRVADQQLPFDFDEESDGTQTWFLLIGPLLTALGEGQILLFDEIDASLHPRLSARLVELFQDPETNPDNAQLIFTTHDTSLLNHLNRDEVWLTEKGADGATKLTALAEYGGDKVRRSLNLEKAYLQGRFGAVPELDQFVVRRALGVVPDGR